MDCESPNCHCQGEVGLVQDGRQFCSELCLKDDAEQVEVCRCGHPGCSTAEELARAEPEATRA